MPKIGDRVVVLEVASQEGWAINACIGVQGVITEVSEEPLYHWDDDLEDDVVVGTEILWKVNFDTVIYDIWGFEITEEYMPEHCFRIVGPRKSGFATFVSQIDQKDRGDKSD